MINWLFGLNTAQPARTVPPSPLRENADESQPTCRRSQGLLHAANNTIEHALVPLPHAAPPLRRSRRLQGGSSRR